MFLGYCPLIMTACLWAINTAIIDNCLQYAPTPITVGITATPKACVLCREGFVLKSGGCVGCWGGCGDKGVQVEAKVEVKAEVKTEVKTEIKTEVKTEVKNLTTSANKIEARNEAGGLLLAGQEVKSLENCKQIDKGGKCVQCFKNFEPNPQGLCIKQELSLTAQKKLEKCLVFSEIANKCLQCEPQFKPNQQGLCSKYDGKDTKANEGDKNNKQEEGYTVRQTSTQIKTDKPQLLTLPSVEKPQPSTIPQPICLQYSPLKQCVRCPDNHILNQLLNACLLLPKPIAIPAGQSKNESVRVINIGGVGGNRGVEGHEVVIAVRDNSTNSSGNYGTVGNGGNKSSLVNTSTTTTLSNATASNSTTIQTNTTANFNKSSTVTTGTSSTANITTNINITSNKNNTTNSSIVITINNNTSPTINNSTGYQSTIVSNLPPNKTTTTPSAPSATPTPATPPAISSTTTPPINIASAANNTGNTTIINQSASINGTKVVTNTTTMTNGNGSSTGGSGSMSAGVSTGTIAGLAAPKPTILNTNSITNTTTTSMNTSNKTTSNTSTNTTMTPGAGPSSAKTPSPALSPNITTRTDPRTNTTITIIGNTSYSPTPVPNCTRYRELTYECVLCAQGYLLTEGKCLDLGAYLSQLGSVRSSYNIVR